jgi:CheY-like chemotaxis protein
VKTSCSAGIEVSEQPVVLIADDEMGPRVSLRFLLQDDYRLLFAEDGMQAVAMVKERPPDLILMDIKMPRLNGWEAIREIRGLGSSVPIIVMTGFPDPSDNEKAVKLGVTHYLSKPFDLSHVQELIKEGVGRQQV